MILFFYGPNSYAARAQVRQMEAAYRAKAGSDFGLERIDGVTASINTLVSNLTAAPFLASSRMVVVEDLGRNKAVAEKVAGLMESIPSTTVVVFIEAAADQRTAYFKQMSKVADKVVAFEQLVEPKASAWVKREVERTGATIDRAALQLLLKLTGDEEWLRSGQIDQWRLSGEIAKLAALDPTITVETVREMVTPTPQQTVFDLVDAMVAGNSHKAVEAYHRLLAERENELKLLSMIQWQLRHLLIAKLSRGQSSQSLAKDFSLSPYAIKKALNRVSGFSEGGVRQVFIDAADTELAIKTGELKPDVAVEQLIFRVSARLGRR